LKVASFIDGYNARGGKLTRRSFLKNPSPDAFGVTLSRKGRGFRTYLSPRGLEAEE
jgi:hypothetical protein